MTGTAQIVITFFGGGVAGAVLNAALGWTTQRRQARAEAVKALAFAAGAWREGGDVFNRARAETLAAMLLAGAESARVESFLAAAEVLNAYQSEALRGGRVLTPKGQQEVSDLEKQMYTELERIRLSLWYPWRGAIYRTLDRFRSPSHAQPTTTQPEPTAD